MSVLNFLLKNLQGCCLLFNYQGSFSLLSSQRHLIYIIIIIVACQQLFYFSFLLSFRSSLPFETAYLEYHFCRHLSTGNFFFFDLFRSFSIFFEVVFQLNLEERLAYIFALRADLSSLQSRLTRQLV